MTRMDDRFDREGDRFDRHPFLTGGKWLVGFVVLIVVVGVVLGIGSFALGWFNAGKDIVSPANVKEQYKTLYGDKESMEALAGKICAIKESPATQNTPTLIEGPAFAYRSQYLNVAADYNRRFDNIFEGKIVAPSDLPNRAPDLEQALAQAGC